MSEPTGDDTLSPEARQWWEEYAAAHWAAMGESLMVHGFPSLPESLLKPLPSHVTGERLTFSLDRKWKP